MSTFTLAERVKIALQETRDAINQIQESGSLPPPISSDDIIDAFERFTLWAGILGALLPPNSPSYSLEVRLVNSPKIKLHICNVLEELLETLQDINIFLAESQEEFESFDHPRNGLPDLDSENGSGNNNDQASPATLLVNELSQSLRALFRTSAFLMRNDSPPDRFQHALRVASVSYPDEYDISHVNHKFPKLRNARGAKWLGRRLGRAITKRRQFIGYCKEHRDRFAEDVEEKDIPPTQAEQTPGRDSRPIVSGATTLCITQDLENRIMHPEEQEDQDEDEAMSLTRAVSTFADTDANTRSLPRLEILQENGQEFECPICFTLQSFSSERNWRIHAYRDLKAYVCTVGSKCENKFFSDRMSWFQHEMAEHRCLYQCILCSESPFREKSSLRQHIALAHGSSFGEHGLILLERAGRQVPTHFSAADCPFCDEWHIARLERHQGDEGVYLPRPGGRQDETSVTAVQFKRHVATHQEQLALFAIPSLADKEDRQDASKPNGPTLSRSSVPASKVDISDDQVPTPLEDPGAPSVPPS